MDDLESAMRKRLAASLKAWMDFRQLNPTDLHKRTSVSRDVVYRMLNGEFPKIENLIAIATELGTDAPSLLAGVMPNDITTDGALATRISGVSPLVLTATAAGDLAQLVAELAAEVSGLASRIERLESAPRSE